MCAPNRSTTPPVLYTLGIFGVAFLHFALQAFTTHAHTRSNNSSADNSSSKLTDTSSALSTQCNDTNSSRTSPNIAPSDNSRRSTCSGRLAAINARNTSSTLSITRHSDAWNTVACGVLPIKCRN